MRGGVFAVADYAVQASDVRFVTMGHAAGKCLWCKGGHLAKYCKIGAPPEWLKLQQSKQALANENADLRQKVRQLEADLRQKVRELEAVTAEVLEERREERERRAAEAAAEHGAADGPAAPEGDEEPAESEAEAEAGEQEDEGGAVAVAQAPGAPGVVPVAALPLGRDEWKKDGGANQEPPKFSRQELRQFLEEGTLLRTLESQELPGQKDEYVDLSAFAIACGAAGEETRLTESHTATAGRKGTPERCQQNRANAWVKGAMTKWYKKKNGDANPPVRKDKRALCLHLEIFLELYAPVP